MALKEEEEEERVELEDERRTGGRFSSDVSRQGTSKFRRKRCC